MDSNWFNFLLAIGHSIVQPDTAFVSWVLIGMSDTESLFYISSVSSISTISIYYGILWFRRGRKLDQILKDNWITAFAIRLVGAIGYWGIACLSLIPLMGFRKASLIISAVLGLRFALIVVLFFHNLRLITEYVFGMSLVHYAVSVIRNILS